MKAIIDERLDVFDLGDAELFKKGEVKMNGVVPDSRFYKGVEEVPNFIKRVFSFMENSLPSTPEWGGKVWKEMVPYFKVQLN